MYAAEPAAVAPGLASRLLHLLLPASCLACNEPVWTPRRSLGLCDGCRRRLRDWPGGCLVCGAGVAGEDAAARCPRCEEPPYDALHAPWRYAPPLDAVVAGLKFRRLDYLGRQLGEALAARLGERLGGPSGADAVAAVPLHWLRRLGRGFDQAERLATSFARALGLPRLDALRRRRPTRPQSRLDRAARLGNLAGAFVVRDPRLVVGRRLLLVDDVVTTGATLAAAAAALRRAGAAGVTAVALARTPPAEERERVEPPRAEM